jgi:pyruvate/2-oxoglutarate dehydrogenase complex dihydrolipoamide dehydrogenase (E3) component
VAFNPADLGNQALLSHVRPPGWTSPAPLPRYDLVVIGGGTAGLVTAAGAAGLGATVALIERDRLGGDCLNTGCVPSKTLLAAAHAAAAIARGAPLGIHATLDAVDFGAVMARVRATRAAIAPHDAAARFAGLGVHVFFGAAAFTSPSSVDVNGARLSFSRAVIATGARPAMPAIDGLHGAAALTSESIFELSEQPRRLAILGGGAVGCELAQAFARLGTRVYLLEAAPRLLPREDADAADVIRAALQRDGVTVMTGATAHHAVRRDEGWQLTITRGAIGDTLEADHVLVAAGRRANTEGLALAVAGVNTDASGRVKVNDFLRTANRRIYAAGDVCLPWQFTHAADWSARLVIRNALFAGRARVSALVLPRATFTDPELASIGVTTEDAQAEGTPVTAFEVPFDTVDRAVTDARTRGFLRVLVRAGSDRIVGATIVGARAGELVSEIAVAMRAGMGLAGLSNVVHPYPGYADAIRRAADACNRTRLTPRAARLLRAWLSLRRRLPGS